MTLADISAAIRRVESVFARRPEAAMQPDTPALARWAGGLRTVTRHDCGTEVVTDMPAELGGGGADASPGWLLRTALASCAVTRIAMTAASEGIALASLDALASSRSDARGLMGVPEAGGEPVWPGPHGVELRVRIAAPGVPADTLRRIVERSMAMSPINGALTHAVQIAVHVEVGGADD